MLNDRQTEAGAPELAGAGLIHAVKTLEHPLQVLRFDPDASVGNRKKDTAIRNRRSRRRILVVRISRIEPPNNRYRTALGRILDRIVDEIIEYLAETLAVGANAAGGIRWNAIGVCMKCNAFRFGRATLAFQTSAGDFRHVDRRYFEGLNVRLDASQHQHVDDQMMQPVGLFFDAAQKALCNFGISAVLERFGISLDRAERRFEFVRDVRHKIAADRFEAAELRRIVKHEHHTRTRLPRQRLHVDIDVQLLCAAAVGLEALRLAGRKTGGNGGVQGVIANDFEQRPAFDIRGVKVKQPAGGRVRQHDSLPWIDGDDAFNHAAQHGCSRSRCAPAPDGGAELAWKKTELWRDWTTLSEGCYLLRSKVSNWADEELWKAYIQLTEAEAAFRIHKSDFSIRPIWHQKDQRVLAHILVCFLAYVLWKLLGQLCERAGLGQEPRRVLAELHELRCVDVILPTRSGPEIRRRSITKPTEHQAILLDRLRLELPPHLRQFETNEMPM